MFLLGVLYFNIIPFWRAFFAPLWAYSCFKHIKTVAGERNIEKSLSIGFLGFGTLFEGFNLIFKMSVALHGKQAQESTVSIDTTVQEKNITYPTDAKLAIKI
jgi:hypothetical protein